RSAGGLPARARSALRHRLPRRTRRLPPKPARPPAGTRGVITRGVITRGVITRGVITRGVITRGVIEGMPGPAASPTTAPLWRKPLGSTPAKTPLDIDVSPPSQVILLAPWAPSS